MAQDDSDESDKQYEPTQKRLDDARKKGDVPMSQDLATSGAYAGLIACALLLGVANLQDLSSLFASLLENSDTLSVQIFDGPATRPIGYVIATTGSLAAPWLIGPLVGVILIVIAQQSFTVSASKIAPKFSRISPLENAKQKFGADGLFNFAKSFVKLLIFSIVLGALVVIELPQMLASLYGSPQALIGFMLTMATKFLAIILGISITIGAIDFFWQRARHLKKNRMSHKDLQDETKESEGDPHFKQKRRQMGMDIATNRMISDVPKADVVIVNPTHYAVALSWDRSKGGAPICLAKGVDEVAARIREVALEAGIPIRRDPPTARALHATLEIGAEVQPEHYRPVAAAIRFAERIRNKAQTNR